MILPEIFGTPISFIDGTKTKTKNPLRSYGGSPYGPMETPMTIRCIFDYPPRKSLEESSPDLTMEHTLVGGSATPLKNMKVNWDDEIPNINGKMRKMATKPPTTYSYQVS